MTKQTNARIRKFDRAVGQYISADFRQWLIDTGFFTAPASTRYHGAYEGGLFDHSWKVMTRLVQLTRRNRLTWQAHRSPYIVGIFHDLCKTDQYRKLKEPDGEKKYEYVETEDKGHGDKSVRYLEKFISLTLEEAMCIIYHMGAFTDREEWTFYSKAVDKFENVLWTHQADMLASHVDKV